MEALSRWFEVADFLVYRVFMLGCAVLMVRRW